LSEDQSIVCEGCGSRWRVDIARGRASVIARLVECPLCEQKEVSTD
jgi:transcription elongation factor Elf1